MNPDAMELSVEIAPGSKQHVLARARYVWSRCDKITFPDTDLTGIRILGIQVGNVERFISIFQSGKGVQARDVTGVLLGPLHATLGVTLLLQNTRAKTARLKVAFHFVRLIHD